MKPLQGRRILVTRPAAQAGTLAGLIAEHGGEAVCFPLIEISAADDPDALRQAISQFDDYSLAVFISPNAVAYSLPQILAARTWPAGLQAGAIGPGTVAQLNANGIAEVIAPDDRFDSTALLERAELQAERVAGKKVLILRGNGGREELTETLRERGAQVDAVTVYRRSPPADPALLLSLLRNTTLDALTISSSEGLRNLQTLLDTENLEDFRRTPVFVPHQRIAEVAIGLGWKKVVLTRPANAGIIEALCAYDWPQHDRT
jgi:uroporphyrinogen-III synthase